MQFLRPFPFGEEEDRQRKGKARDSEWNKPVRTFNISAVEGEGLYIYIARPVLVISSRPQRHVASYRLWLMFRRPVREPSNNVVSLSCSSYIPAARQLCCPPCSLYSFSRRVSFPPLRLLVRQSTLPPIRYSI